MPDLNNDGIDDVEQVNSCLLAKGLRFTACAWRSAWKAVEGIKTLTLASALGFIGLIDQLGGVDLLQTLQGQASNADNPRLGKWLMGIMVAFIVLSFLTKRASDGDAEPTAAPSANVAAAFRPPTGVDEGEAV
jgi:nitrate/nitrite transporter NarK